MSTHHRQLIIDSRDRINPNANFEEGYIFQMPIQLNGVQSVELICANIPMTMYNINDSNNMIYFESGGDPYELQMDNGNYTMTEFITALEDILNTEGLFTVNYSYLTMKISFTSESPIIFKWSNTTNSMAYIIGFPNEDTESSSSHTAPNVANLSVPLYLNILIPEFNFSIKSTNYKDNATFTIYDNCNNSDILTWSANSFCRQVTTIMNDNIQTIHVRIASWDNKTVNLQGCDWSMILRLDYCN